MILTNTDLMYMAKIRECAMPMAAEAVMIEYKELIIGRTSDEIRRETQVKAIDDIDSLIEQLDEVLASESDDANPSHRLVYLDPDKAAALITAHDGAIRRELADCTGCWLEEEENHHACNSCRRSCPDLYKTESAILDEGAEK